MTFLNSWFFTFWIVCFMTICKCSEELVQRYEGETVTLPCKYNSRYHGKCDICWMRGDIPKMGCGDEIIASDGDKVVRRVSQKYDLAGHIQNGDVSLTIYNIDKTDAGKYGCRIHVPGWFNDEMYYVDLVVDDAPIPTTRKTTSMSSSTSAHETTGVSTTAMTEAPGPTEPEPELTTISGRITSKSQTTDSSGVKNRTHENSSSVGSTEAPKRTTELWPTSTMDETSVPVPKSDPESSSAKSQDNVIATSIIVPVVLLLLALIAISGILIWKQKKKTNGAADIAQNSDVSVIYNNMGSTVGLYNRETVAVENVYQIQTENDYEQWH